MIALGLQAVFCKTVDKDGKRSPMPMAGTTGSAPFGAFEMPSKGYTRPAFRMPPGAIALDVDQKPGKSADGAATLRAAEAELGELPPTYRLTAHGFEQESGRLLYQVPEWLFVDEGFFAQYGGAVDVIRTGHRFSMAPGDVHHDTGTEVVCWEPNGHAAELPPVSEWPHLPLDWVLALDEWNDRRGERGVPAGEGAPRGLEAVVSAKQAHAMVISQLDKITSHDVAGSGFRAKLMSASLTLGGFVGSLYPDSEAAIETLSGVVRDLWGLDPDADDMQMIESGVVKGAASPWVVMPAEPEADPVAAADKPDEKPNPFIVLASPAQPAVVAREVDAILHQRGKPLLISHDDWYQYDAHRYVTLQVPQVRALLYRLTEHASYKTKEGPQPWNPNVQRISSLRDALAGLTDHFATAGAWTGEPVDRPDTGPVLIPCRNGIVDPGRGELLPHDPRWFFTYCLPFDYDPEALCPIWLETLNAQWEKCPDTIKALQEWFGYLVSGRTDLQKLALLHGPKRSGKGTIARVAQSLMGTGGSSGIRLSDLTENFGMENLIHVPLAIMGDARWSGGSKMDQAVSRLLELTGNDEMSIARKHKTPWSGQPPARLMIMSNDAPDLPDTSGAIASRMLVFATSASFYNREDAGLGKKLTGELPGILMWALEGLARLTAQGRFTEPEGAAEQHQEMMMSGSPVAAFLVEQCELDPAAETLLGDLFTAYRDWWFHTNSMDNRGALDRVRFSKALRSIIPQPVARKRVRVADGSQQVLFSGVRIVADARMIEAARDFDPQN